MPLLEYGNSPQFDTISDVVAQERFQYDYPDGLDFTPGSVLHDKLRDFVMQRAYDSSLSIRGRHSAWSSLDQKLTSYIPLDKREQNIKSKDPRKPVSIVLPVTYATLETFLTFLTAAFLDDFLFRYDGVGPEDVIGSKILQHLMNQQFIAGDMGLNMHTLWRDALVYNFGGIAVDWEVKTRMRRVKDIVDINTLRDLGIDSGLLTDSGFEESIVYEGNRFTNLDPYYSLPYPHAPVYNVQRAEWTGWIRPTNYSTLLRDEISTGNYFNVRYLKRIDGRSSLSLVKTGRTDKTSLLDRGEQVTYGTTKPIDVIDMYIDIIPSEVGLGGSENLERWVVSLAGDQIIIQAAPLGLVHNMYPLAITSPTSDGHSLLDISILEIGEGMSEFFTWLINSKMANVRSAINNAYIIDPKLINEDDFSTAEAGLRIRLNHATWGLGLVDKAVKQLDVHDVTTGHISDAFSMLDMNNRFLGTVDALQGVVRRGGERVTAEEISNTFRSALSRLEKMARIISMQAHIPLARICAYNTQELMSESTYIKLVGDLGEELQSELGSDREVAKGRMAISPEDLDVNFDVLAHDGSIPTGGGNVREWVDLLINFISKTPVGTRIDFDKVFLAVSRRMGEKNAHKFLKPPQQVEAQVMPDSQVEEQVNAGNLVPSGELTNGKVG